MLQTIKLNNEKWKKSSFYEEKSFLGLTPAKEKKTDGHSKHTLNLR
jgi:hypothetical protein